MILFFSEPIVTPIVYGPVEKDGKQTVSICGQDGARHVYATSKDKIDKFQKSLNKCNIEQNKRALGIWATIASGAASLYAFKTSNVKPVYKKLGIAGLVVAGLSTIYTVIKFKDYNNYSKQASNVLNEIKESNCIK